MPFADVQLHDATHDGHEHDGKKGADVDDDKDIVQQIGEVQSDGHAKGKQDSRPGAQGLGHEGTPAAREVGTARDSEGAAEPRVYRPRICCSMRSATAAGAASEVSTVRCAWRYQGRRAVQRACRRARSARTGRTGAPGCPEQREIRVSRGASRKTMRESGMEKRSARVAAVSTAPPPRATTRFG